MPATAADLGHAVDTTAIGRRIYLRAGPRRGWYVVAALLWVAGWLGLFGYGYAEQHALDAAARDYSSAAIGGTVRFTVDEAATYAVWVRVEPGRPRSAAVAATLREPRFVRPVITGPAGTVRARPATVRDHRATGTRGQLGYAVAQFDARPGKHQVSLPDSVLAGDSSVRGFVVGPVPESAYVEVLGGAVAVSLSGLLLGGVVHRRRAKARRKVVRA